MGMPDNDSDQLSDEIDERPWRQLLKHQYGPSGEPQLTVRAALAGLFLGTLLCFTNMYFGLQSGWITMGSIQMALVGFGLFQLPCLASGRRPFGPHENVVVQTIGVATATLPLAGGFIGILPAMKLLDPPVVLTVGQQLAWAAALTYFGIFFAVPLRRQTILVEKLRFPSGTATAKLIQLMHSGNEAAMGAVLEAGGSGRAPTSPPWRVLGASFAASFGVSALATFALPSGSFHVFSWVGLPSLTAWRWTLRPALSYVGQGMIMGPRSAISLFVGSVIGWGWLGPMAQANGWTHGKIFDFEHGAQGCVSVPAS